jgi:hypothetical protein
MAPTVSLLVSVTVQVGEVFGTFAVVSQLSDQPPKVAFDGDAVNVTVEPMG